MKRLVLFALACVCIGGALPAGASAIDFETFVGCDALAENPVPAEQCSTSDRPAAYFESNGKITYYVCLEYPDSDFVCGPDVEAEADTLYVDELPTDIEGLYTVYWFLPADSETEPAEEQSFKLVAPPAPPTPPVQPVVPVTPTVVPPGDSLACKKAKARVAVLRKRLKSASGPAQKAKLRAKLKKARGSVKSACS